MCIFRKSKEKKHKREGDFQKERGKQAFQLKFRDRKGQNGDF